MNAIRKVVAASSKKHIVELEDWDSNAGSYTHDGVKEEWNDAKQHDTLAKKMHSLVDDNDTVYVKRHGSGTKKWSGKEFKEKLKKWGDNLWDMTN